MRAAIWGVTTGLALTMAPRPLSSKAARVRAEARPAVEIAAGTVPWLVVCGLCEGFLTGPELPVALQLAIGVALFVLFWGLVIWRGRPAHSRARAFARR